MKFLVLTSLAFALILPNRLNWRSDSPYLESLTGVANYKEGSGRGRLIQWNNTLAMAAHHPLLGVGPGNWPVFYPRYMSKDDPSFDRGNCTQNRTHLANGTARQRVEGYRQAVLVLRWFLDGTRVEARPLRSDHDYRRIALVWRRSSPREEEFRLLAETLRQISRDVIPGLSAAKREAAAISP